MQESIADFEAHNATLVALSPQLPEFNARMVDNHKLSFDILSDPGNSYADALGLRFRVPDDISEIYRSFGIDLPANNGDDSWTLPMPGRIIIGRDGIVTSVEVDPDYTARPEPAATLAELKAMAG